MRKHEPHPFKGVQDMKILESLFGTVILGVVLTVLMVVVVSSL